MNTKDFESSVTYILAHCKKLLNAKAAEYATDDRLHNFKVAAFLEDCTTEQALGGMMCKHIVSIYDMIHNGQTYYPKKLWDEKIGDSINYLLLLHAVVTEMEEQSHDVDIAFGGIIDEDALAEQKRDEVIRMNQKDKLIGERFWFDGESFTEDDIRNLWEDAGADRGSGKYYTTKLPSVCLLAKTADAAVDLARFKQHMDEVERLYDAEMYDSKWYSDALNHVRMLASTLNNRGYEITIEQKYLEDFK